MPLFAVPENQRPRAVDERGAKINPERVGARKANTGTKYLALPGGKKKHAWRSPVGVDQYGNHPARPHWSQQVGNARFWANAAVNNKTTAATAAGAGAAGVAQTQRKKMTEDQKKVADTATAAAGGAFVANQAGSKRVYGKLRQAQKMENNLDWAQPDRNGRPTPKNEHKKTFKPIESAARRAGGKPGMSDAEALKATTVRQSTRYKDANFPEGFKSSKTRRWVGSGAARRGVNRATLATGVLAGAAAYGAHSKDEIKSKLKKSDSISAFGVEHGY